MPIPSVVHNTYENFKNATLGNQYDIDGYPVSQPYQCWDYVDLLYQQSDIGQYLYTASNVGETGDGAKTCWTSQAARERNGSGYFSCVYDVTAIKKGDIIVFNEYGGWYSSAGHIGFADEDYNGTEYIQLLSQNFYGHHYVTVERAYLGSAFLGVFRYSRWNDTPVQKKKSGTFPWPIAWNYWQGFKK